MTSAKLKLSILAALILAAIASFIAVTQLSSPVEQDLMSEFKNSPSVTASSGSQNSSAGVAPVDELLVGLEQRLESEPDDVDGWVLLSKSYYHLNRMAEAQSAFEKARALGYNGNWQPLPRIDSFSQNHASSQKFTSTLNIRDYKIDGEGNQSTGQVGETVSPPQ
jgi:hypothetical protein